MSLYFGACMGIAWRSSSNRGDCTGWAFPEAVANLTKI